MAFGVASLYNSGEGALLAQSMAGMETMKYKHSIVIPLHRSDRVLCMYVLHLNGSPNKAHNGSPHPNTFQLQFLY